MAGDLRAEAAYKIAVALLHGHRNIGFLALECVAAVAGLATLAARFARRRANARGQAYLGRV